MFAMSRHDGRAHEVFSIGVFLFPLYSDKPAAAVAVSLVAWA
jgi:hypothetical protein